MEEESKPVETPKKGRPKKNRDRKRTNGEGSIYQRPDGLWVGQVVIGRSAQTGDLVKKYVYGRDQGDVVAKKNKLLQQNRDIIDIDADSITVRDWINRYLEIYAKTRVRENTLVSYKYVAENHIYDHIGSIKLGKLRSIQIQSMVNKILDEGNSARTAQYAFAVLRAAIRQAMKEEILFRNPALAVSLPRIRRKEIRPLTENEWKSIFATAKKYSMRVYREILVEWATGMRRSELLGLKWADLDEENSTITVQRAVMNAEDGPKLDDTKTEASRRTLGLPEFVMAELRKHRALQAAAQLKSTDWNDLNLIFSNNHGGLQVPNTLSKAFARIASEARLTGVTFHKLRHDHASRLVIEGIHLKKVQTQLGHSSITTTMDIYSHLAPGAQAEITDFLTASRPIGNAPDNVNATTVSESKVNASKTKVSNVKAFIPRSEKNKRR